ncbi:hypothetical protein AALP_AA5G258400 [Arabis alpina]|uniref:Pentacotripeptide-repeat region of PRORP domain-containing protein n=1 Tax=Arabis alpina TaxID=50452 RepID=A0A087GZD6_ARAAL|nr:hypothetical protein AALP_AA5G258400 [Arabis alpina]
MTKWSIVKRINVYGASSFISLKHLVLAPADLSSNCSFSGLINTGEEDEEELLKKMVKHSESGSNIISKIDYMNLVDKYTRYGNLSAAYDLLQSLQEKNICLPISVSENLLVAAEPSLIRMIARTCLVFSKKYRSLLFRMKEWQCKPDVITYNSVLDILGRAGLVNEMLELFSSMKEDCDVSLNIITYNTVINGMKKACRFDMCLVLYNEMVQCGIEPDLLSYTAVIDSLGRSGNIKEALRLFVEMKKRQIQPSVYVYRALIDCLKKSGDFHRALQLSDELKNTSSLDLAGPQDFKRHLRSHRR